MGQQLTEAKDKQLSEKILKIINKVVMFLPFLSLFMMNWRTDSDTYWIIKTGEYICKNGIPTKRFSHIPHKYGPCCSTMAFGYNILQAIQSYGLFRSDIACVGNVHGFSSFVQKAVP